MSLRPIAVTAVVTLAACDEPLTSANCTDVSVAGVAVTMVDSATVSPLDVSATVRVTDGAYVDSATVAPGRRAALAFNRGGTYVVTVTAPGYRTWTTSGVAVRAPAPCFQPETANLTARLVR
jgi:hypothetical protein